MSKNDMNEVEEIMDIKTPIPLSEEESTNIWACTFYNFDASEDNESSFRLIRDSIKVEDSWANTYENYLRKLPGIFDYAAKDLLKISFSEEHIITDIKFTSEYWWEGTKVEQLDFFSRPVD
ncbi:hypothetical protein Glove_185g24 [Diversispora epigaea]|uniref:Uncharacterized protein n=1 Tax=Diversispora epigaea TaxID=1348612 RepID=A0A397IW39_9GLOM|nr:hypothetical protein Glove_185g24 [Diversispora epigaea]